MVLKWSCVTLAADLTDITIHLVVLSVLLIRIVRSTWLVWDRNAVILVQARVESMLSVALSSTILCARVPEDTSEIRLNTALDLLQVSVFFLRDNFMSCYNTN